MGQGLKTCRGGVSQSETLLWTNPNPNSIFLPTTINLSNLFVYRQYKIVMKNITTTPYASAFIFDNLNKYDSTMLVSSIGLSFVTKGNLNIVYRLCQVYDNRIVINKGQSEASPEDNTSCIPIEIYVIM